MAISSKYTIFAKNIKRTTYLYVAATATMILVIIVLRYTIVFKS